MAKKCSNPNPGHTIADGGCTKKPNHGNDHGNGFSQWTKEQGKPKQK